MPGSARRSKLSRKHAQRAAEPWLLIASPSLQFDSASQRVRWYKTRMQIEESFRDTKSTAYGLGIANGRYTSFVRAANLLLIAALARFVLWAIGSMAKARRWDVAIHVNPSRRSADYSTLFLARLVIRHSTARLPLGCLNQVHKLAAGYLDSLSTA